MPSHWAEAIEAVRNHVFLIETPGSQGTAFLVPSHAGSSNLCVVTAFHVIEHAFKWGEPIKLTHFPTQKETILDINSRIISPASTRDQALIEFKVETIPLSPSLNFISSGEILGNGSEIGWIGYPSVAPSSLCLFFGHISAWLESDEAYLVDGVAINGVSGGPAFTFLQPGNPVFIGLVTEYRPNLALGVPLPGLSLVRSINPLSRFYDHLEKMIDLAKVQDIQKSLK